MKTKYFLLFLFFLLTHCRMQAETFAVGTYIVNMGVTPQTVGNGMKPYGLVYEFLKTYNIPVRWVIGAGKAKDSADFTYNGTKYKGGTFIIPKEYITSTIKTRITYWKGQGVVMDSTTTSLTVTVTQILTSAPKWTLSTVNTSLASGMFTYAGIPSSSYNTNSPASLGACDDIFAMPHADPTWTNHGNLYYWNRNNKGAIWASCHAISVLESLVNPSNSAEQMNFLSTQGLINYGSHADGTPAFSYFFNRASYNGASISARPDDPVFQMMGIEDGAHSSGSEQIYIPLSGSGSGWRNTTKIGCYDSTQSNVSAFPNGPAAVTLYGRGFGLNTAGYVMYESGHNITGTGTANVAAMRQFFNFSFMAMGDKVPVISASTINSTLNSQTTYSFNVTASSPVGASLGYMWSSTLNGTFSNPTSSSTSFSTTQVYTDTVVTITCLVTDACGRSTFLTRSVQVLAALPVKLIRFNGELVNNSVRLDWTSAEENGLKNFEIERSVDADNFEKIANADAKGNYNSENTYSYTDNKFNPNQGILFYRLKMLDFDGNYITSEPLEISLSKPGSGILSLGPLPSGDFIYLELKSLFSTYESVELTDICGREVMMITQPEITGARSLKLDISKYTSGVYFISLRKKSGELSIAKFIKN